MFHSRTDKKRETEREREREREREIEDITFFQLSSFFSDRRVAITPNCRHVSTKSGWVVWTIHRLDIKLHGAATAACRNARRDWVDFLEADMLPCEPSIFWSWVQILVLAYLTHVHGFDSRTMKQVELFTHCFCVQNVVQRLQKEDVRLAAVHLVDAYHCG